MTADMLTPTAYIYTHACRWHGTIYIHTHVDGTTIYIHTHVDGTAQ